MPGFVSWVRRLILGDQKTELAGFQLLGQGGLWPQSRTPWGER